MSELNLPVRKYIPVWIHERKNPRRKDGGQSSSYTLEWVEYGQRQFMSLGKRATKGFAEAAKRQKEKELNATTSQETLEPITFSNFRKTYLDTLYPGHDLPREKGKPVSRQWTKSVSCFRGERLAMNNFQRLIIDASPTGGWCHQLTSADQATYVNKRLDEVNSAESVDTDLRNLRTVFNTMENWNHRPKESNPFAGRKQATVGARRKREKEVANKNKKAAYYTRPQIVAILKQADKDVADHPTDSRCQRLRALIYFAAYSGARIKEILHLEWDEIELEQGIAWLNWKIENGFKTKGSEAPVGLPDVLLGVMKDWKAWQQCRWAFPNTDGNPWISAGPGYKPLDQLKELAGRAGVTHATFKMFRHSLNTHGKQWFGLNKEQMRVQLRHEDTTTQQHYDHADLGNLRSAVKSLNFCE